MLIKLKEVLDEYSYARSKITKALRKMTYRIDEQSRYYHRFKITKKMLNEELKSMDRVIRQAVGEPKSI